MLAGLAEYNSDGEPERNGNGAQPGLEADSDDDSYFVGSDSNSEDSAVRRRCDAERRLFDCEEALSASAELPDPLAVLCAATQRPRFLDPEATRPLAEPVHRRRPPRPAAEPAERLEGGQKRAPGEWDIASMAPLLKGAEEAKPGVISAPAKRYRTDERVGSSAVTAAQVAMLGGEWDGDRGNEAPGSAVLRGPVPLKTVAAKASKPSKAMDVADFVNKGGGALLPRKQQERRDKEKRKRLAGQSAIGSWKSETEMQLRQLYDS
ncbi:hypothetical protein WJX81_002884 [Elliptochloris bilobata]|uniref:Uncharacterized protein n=1 Tax=Elliptochloris bilobata TaxID=381761 RepID=A0AAW1QV65_9CHLO